MQILVILSLFLKEEPNEEDRPENRISYLVNKRIVYKPALLNSHLTQIGPMKFPKNLTNSYAN